jgi:hypothetical protein
MSNPPCLNHLSFLIMNNKIKKVVVKLDIMDDQLRKLFVLCLPFVLSDPFSKTNDAHPVFSRRIKQVAQPLAAQAPANFLAQLNTNEHELFTHPDHDQLGSFGPFATSSTTELSKPPSKTNTKKHEKTHRSLRQKEHTLDFDARRFTFGEAVNPDFL